VPAISGDFGYFFPLTYVKREATFTQDQVDDVLGQLVTGIKAKWAFFGVLLAFGVAFLGLTVFCGCRYRKLSKELFPNGDVDEDEFEDALDSRVLLPSGGGIGKTTEDGSDLQDFDNQPPFMQQQERVFNLHGQGKPIAELSGSDSREISG
jgi:hypothetical protein